MQPKDLAKATGKKKATIKSAVRRMEESGELERLEKGHGLYRLPGSGDDETKSVTKATDSEDVGELFREDATLTVFTEVEAEAGSGRVQYPEEARHTIDIPRHFISKILGFTPPSRVGVMTASGDSMRPTIQDGDLILWRPAEEVRGGGIYVILLDGRQVVKRVQTIPGGGYKIISDNDFHDYDNTILVPSDNGEALLNNETGRSVDMRVVGSVIFPNRDTDTMHVKQVAEIIRSVAGGDVDMRGLTQ